MKISATQIMEKIEQVQFANDAVTKQADKLKPADYEAQANKMVDFVIDALNSGRLAQTQFAVQAETPVTFSLETNIINLPFSNWKKINNFFTDDETPEVNVYLEIESDAINVSKFRIDKIGSGDEFMENAAQIKSDLAKLMPEKVDFVQENAKVLAQKALEYEEARKVLEANKKAEAKAKKTSTKKKTTTKKTTAKKTAAKKATTKKAATKKPAAKKTVKEKK